MLQTCPEIHGNGAELNLRFHVFPFVGQENRNIQYQMKASVAVILRVFDIVLFAQKKDVPLSGKKLRKTVNIVGKRADNPQSRHVGQLFPDILYRDRISLALQLLIDALRRL